MCPNTVRHGGLRGKDQFTLARFLRKWIVVQYEVTQSRELSEADKLAGSLSDEVVVI